MKVTVYCGAIFDVEISDELRHQKPEESDRAYEDRLLDAIEDAAYKSSQTLSVGFEDFTDVIYEEKNGEYVNLLKE